MGNPFILPGGIEVTVNRFVPPDAKYAMPQNLTPTEQLAIRRAGDQAEAAGKPRKPAEFEALIATGKIVRVILGTQALADLKAAAVAT